jgi:hypothetical protein
MEIGTLTRDSDVSRAKLLCKEQVSDTLANEFHQKAENLMAAIEAGTAVKSCWPLFTVRQYLSPVVPWYFFILLQCRIFIF